MLREHLHPEPGFEWRGGEITRLEAFSDAVFAFAVTLLVVSLEVPHTFDELLDVIRGFPAFAICFSMLLLVWYNHSKFFRRYGFQDPLSHTLNGALLFVVLFYVYPLKFLFTILVGVLTHGATLPHAHIPGQEIIGKSGDSALMIIYGMGFASVFGLFAVMYSVAYSRREKLALSAVETFRTLHSLVDNCAMASFGVFSTILALALPHKTAFAGWIYMLIPVYHTLAGMTFGKKERMILAKLEKEKSRKASQF